MNAYTKLSEKGQVVVPKAVRDRLGWLPGTDLEIVEASDTVTLRPRRRDGKLTVEEAVERFRALYQHKGPPVPIEELSWFPFGDDDPA